jgi:hypothetical protein
VADVAVVVVPADHLHISVTIGPHEDVQLLPHRVHGGRRLSQPFHTEKRRGSAGFIRVSAGSESKRRCSLPRWRCGDGEEEMRSGSSLWVAGSPLSLSRCCFVAWMGWAFFLHNVGLLTTLTMGWTFWVGSIIFLHE